MSADGAVTIAWADGDHRFRIRLKEWREIQKNCGAGLIKILDRLASREWMVDDVREPIRVGLIGGGMTPTAALDLVQRYIDDRPLMESVPVAFAVLMAAVVGDPEDTVGKPPAESDGTDDSRFRPSMAPAVQ